MPMKDKRFLKTNLKEVPHCKNGLSWCELATCPSIVETTMIFLESKSGFCRAISTVTSMLLIISILFFSLATSSFLMESTISCFHTLSLQFLKLSVISFFISPPNGEIKKHATHLFDDKLAKHSTINS